MKIKNKPAIERARKAQDYQRRRKDAIAVRVQERAEENRKKSKARWDLRKKIGVNEGVSSSRVVLKKSAADCKATKELVRGEHYSIKKPRPQK